MLLAAAEPVLTGTTSLLLCQVINIDIKGQSPVGNGTVICASVYCGPDVDFGTGPTLWIDNLHDDTTLEVPPPTL